MQNVAHAGTFQETGRRQARWLICMPDSMRMCVKTSGAVSVVVTLDGIKQILHGVVAQYGYGDT
jgi:hypothetical protein